jgi:hypothetical protein
MYIYRPGGISIKVYHAANGNLKLDATGLLAVLNYRV